MRLIKKIFYRFFLLKIFFIIVIFPKIILANNINETNTSILERLPTSIFATVNNEPISIYDLIQRSNLFSVSAKIPINEDFEIRILPELISGYIDEMIQMQEIKKGATFVATSYRFDNSKTIVNPASSIDIPIDIFLSLGIGTSTVILTKELLENHKFREIRFAQDIDFWFTLAKSQKFKYAGISEVFVEYNTGGSTKNKWVQLFYVNKILNLNNISIFTRIRVNISYILTGLYNHYIKNLLFSRK